MRPSVVIAMCSHCAPTRSDLRHTLTNLAAAAARLSTRVVTNLRADFRWVAGGPLRVGIVAEPWQSLPCFEDAPTKSKRELRLRGWDADSLPLVRW